MRSVVSSMWQRIQKNYISSHILLTVLATTQVIAILRKIRIFIKQYESIISSYSPLHYSPRRASQAALPLFTLPPCSVSDGRTHFPFCELLQVRGDTLNLDVFLELSVSQLVSHSSRCLQKTVLSEASNEYSVISWGHGQRHLLV